MEKLPDNKKQEKLAKVFRAVISAGLVAPVFVSVSACEKAKPVVEEAQATTTIPTTSLPVVQETAPPTTVVETVPPTTQTAPETTAEVIFNASAIDGLRFDKETKNYLAEANNPYGLKEDELAGVYVKDAFVIKENLADSVTLDAKIISYLQEKLFKEKKDYFFPVPLAPKDGEKIKIDELKRELPEKYGGGFERVLGMNLSVGEIFYSPFYTEEWHVFWVKPQPFLVTLNDIQKGNQVAGASFYFNEIEMVPKSYKQEEIVNMETGEKMGLEESFKVKLGDPLGKIIGESTCDALANRTEGLVYDNPGEYQFGFIPVNYDHKELGGLASLIKIGETAYASFLEESASEQTN